MSITISPVLTQWLQATEDVLCYSPDVADEQVNAPPCAWCGFPLYAFVETPALPATAHGALCPVCHRLSVRDTDESVRRGSPEELPDAVRLFLQEALRVS